jgi:hypothetical protein
VTAPIPRLALRFHKPSDPSKFGGLEILRADGSNEYQPSPRAPGFIVHDLAHYAVETVLDRNDSFLALLARGHPLGRIADTESVWVPELPDEAKGTEIIVSILQSEFAGYMPGDTDADTFNAHVARACAERSLPCPTPVTAQQLTRLRSTGRNHHQEYSNTRPGSYLELAFPATPEVNRLARVRSLPCPPASAPPPPPTSPSSSR